MAKKKSSKQQQQQQQDQTLQNPSSEMEELIQETNEIPVASESDKKKISNLKALNEMLVQKTVEMRQEIRSLMESNMKAESELSEVIRTNSEFDVAKEVCSVFIESQILEGLVREREAAEKKLEEMEREMGEVVKERNEIEKAKFDGDLQIGVMKRRENDLRNEVKREKDGCYQVVLERNELESELNKMKEKIGELEGWKEKWEVSAKLAKEKEDELGLVRDELGVVERRCEDLRGEIEGLKAESEAVSEDLRRERDEKGARIGELEQEVRELNVAVMRKEEDVEAWRGRYSELEGKYGEVIAELERVNGGIGVLIEDKNGKEREIERLREEKSKVVSSLAVLEEEIKTLRLYHDEIIGEKNDLQEVKLRQEGEIGELKNQLNDVRGKLALLQESNQNYVEKNRILESEIDDHKRVLNQTRIERDDAKKSLELEKKNGAALQVRVSDISKRMEETAKVIDGFKGASDTLVAEKKEIENKYNKLVKDKELTEKKLVAANGKIDELNGSLKVKSDMYKSVLTLLKKTVKQLSAENVMRGDNKGAESKDRSVSGEMKPIVEELEAMMAVFREREEKAGEMQQQMESLQSSLAGVKKKSFWTLVSSATTIFAAVVYAYATRVR